MDRMFINPKLSSSMLDRYYIRFKIFEFITNSLPILKGDLLDVGCGKMPYREYILNDSRVERYVGLDIENAINYDSSIRAELTWDGIYMPIKDSSYNTVIATEVLEHCPAPQTTLSEIYRVMKPQGTFLFTVPFLWNLHETPHDEYRYTPFALHRLLTAAGFENITLNATGGWHASLAQMLGLWVCRAPLNYYLRRILAIIVMPIYKFLLKKDNIPNEFHDGCMITGLSGVAYKPI